jgi:hypothetical protein
MMLRLLLTALMVCSCTTDAVAHHFRYTAYLTGPAESPPNTSGGAGHVVITLDVDEGIMQVETTFAQLAGTATEAHIHAPTASVGSGTVDSATQLPSFPDFPTGVQQADYDHEFDLLQPDTYSPAFFAASGGITGDALAALVSALDAGKAYFDIHTTAFANGEIRGFLSRVPNDFNDNGIVDAADYVMWRKNLLTTGEGLKADSNNDNLINDDDYNAWRQNFGHAGLTAPPGSGAAIQANVSEPRTLFLVALALITVILQPRARS